MLTKWKIALKGFEKYRFDTDGNLWKMPFTSQKRSYSWRMIKMCRIKKRWKIGTVWWSQRQIKPHIIIDDNPLQIYKTGEMPF
jgi:hypothetical protein